MSTQTQVKRLTSKSGKFTKSSSHKGLWIRTTEQFVVLGSLRVSEAGNTYVANLDTDHRIHSGRAFKALQTTPPIEAIDMIVTSFSPTTDKKTIKYVSDTYGADALTNFNAAVKGGFSQLQFTRIAE